MGRPVEGEFLPLEPIRQAGGKHVLAWAVRADFDPTTLRSNTFSMEWPPKSGRQQQFPEVDKAAWFDLDDREAEDTERTGGVARRAGYQSQDVQGSRAALCF